MTTSSTGTERWKTLDFGPPSSGQAEPDQPVLLEFVSGDRVAVITLNRPHADNAITTDMGARLTEILETIAVRPAVRVAIITGAGERAFSVGSDLRQRKNMTKEQWLRQRQDFDRTLYTLRELRKPIFAAVNGIAYGGGSEIAQSTDFIIASENATFGQPEAMIGLAAGGGSPALLPARPPAGEGAADADDRRSDQRAGGVPAGHGQRDLRRRPSSWTPPTESRRRSRATHRRRYRRSSAPSDMGEGQPIEQAIAIMMEAHWRSAVHPDRIEGIGAFNDDRDPSFQDPDY